MSRENVLGLQAVIDRAHALTLEFIDVCPENILTEKFGGWPIWQHLYHSYACYPYFLLEKDGTWPKLVLGEAVAWLDETPAEGLNKAQLKECAASLKAFADAAIAKLSDADLLKKNEGFASRTGGKELTMLFTLSMLASHTFYHLGSCDAALRQQGLKGVF